MTLVYREEKKDVFAPDRNQLGPGFYKLDRPSKCAEYVVPFNSSIKRTLFRETQSTVGPGMYSLQSCFKSKSQQESYIFKSDLRRFKGPKDQQGDSEDEGRDELNQIGHAERKIAVSKISKIEQRLNRYNTIPSIPTLKESFGYQMDENDQLVLNKNPRDIMSRLDEIRNNCRVKPPKESSEFKSKLPREPFKPKQQIQPSSMGQTGTKWQSNTIKYKKTQFINSQDRRMALLSMRHRKQFEEYCSQPDLSSLQDLTSLKTGWQELGTKICNTSKDCVTRVGSQCFGSTVQRFNLAKSLVEQHQYQHQHQHQHQQPVASPIPNPSKTTKKVSCLPTAQRFGRVNVLKLPGPGSYISNEPLHPMPGGSFQKQSTFIRKATDNEPGPGEYADTMLKTTNFQRFKSIQVRSRLGCQESPQLREQIMYSSVGNLNQIQGEKRPRPINKPYPFIAPVQFSLKTIKQRIKNTIDSGQPKEQTSSPRVLDLKGKVLKSKMINRRKQAWKSELGPGCYPVETPYGKPTFNVSYS